MKTLYFDCTMGAAGDMLTAALLELHPDPAAFLRRFNGLGLPGVTTRYELVTKNGLHGAQVSVSVDGVEEGPDGETDAETHEHRHHHHHHHHHHSERGWLRRRAREEEHAEGESTEESPAEESRPPRPQHRRLRDIEELLNAIPVSRKARQDALAVYRLLAKAESEAHGRPVEQIHFHEVGELDAIADVLAVSMLMDELAPERVLASPVELGGGTVRCAHGELPVPAPATALLLRDVPVSKGAANTELCTPTGAALLRYFVQEFCPMPPLRLERTGVGLGKKELARPNALRVFLGEEEQQAEHLCELRCNLDDTTGEALAFAQERLLEAGALDAWTQAIGMKKGRPGVLLCALCTEEKREELLRLLFRHTTTLGVRVFPCERYGLERRVEERATALGKLRVKTAEGFGVRREKPEYEDLARLARERDASLAELRDQLGL